MVSLNKKTSIFLIFSIIMLSSCSDRGFFKKPEWGEPEKDGKELARQNVKEGKGIQIRPQKNQGGNFLFASSNPMWRASLETIDFMPLALANYSGGILVTDWYSEGKNLNESIKISVRFLTNEVRSDALDIKIFYKKCSSFENCEVIESSGNLESELKKKILAKAALYAKLSQEKKKKDSTPYVNEALKTNQ